MLQIHNNLSRKKESFQPIDDKNVRLYVCGMTVYDFCHVGHARVMVVFDVVYRYLCHLYGKEAVTYVRNVTDIDDKIIKRANENSEPYSSLTERFITEMKADEAALGILPPDQEPRATHYMQEILEMIQTLVDKGVAYAAKNGDVYYDISKFESYGQLSGKRLEDLRVGERVAVDESKNDPMDFVLWKSAKPGEPSWESPWGAGRPGWHIECSAMSTCCLGNHFDIHGGGLDLQFPHHENEIAQSEAATGEKFANVWMHNGFVRINDEKMSKSLNNFFTIREVLKIYDAEVVRSFILNSHYRSPLNYSDSHLDEAKNALTTLYTALRGIEIDRGVEMTGEMAEKFFAAMNDDFNTPAAMAVLFELAGKVNKARNRDHDKAVLWASQLKQLAATLGILQREPQAFFQNGTAGEAGISNEQIEQLIQQRLDARKSKAWAESDRIRDQLKAEGIILEDSGQGTTWRRE
ncbi:MAG: cysteine--tRNA ligase [Gammaproteobacteria bacterium]|nr:cysteine--tRNA ligase [Gammaproteobacteria bacterium]MCF6229294.1 cysteine--tRNA ligase [Gammaproteobacteria bacterium]